MSYGQTLGMRCAVQREFGFEDRDFVTLSKLAKQLAGIVLSERKRDLVYGRLSRRVRALGFNNFAAYCAHLESPEGQSEIGQMVNAITTNLTGFFREPHHFEILAEEVLPNLAKLRSTAKRRLRIWSAGCSSGEEPYSIAMTVYNVLGSGAGWDAKILATDIDTQMVAIAQAGRYAAEKCSSIPVTMQRLFLEKAGEENVEMSESLKSLIIFRPLNLFDSWPMNGPFDVIFCRNVVIYFDTDAKRELFNRFANILTPGGFLFIGHSESLYQISNRFCHVGRTTYRRVS
jgi:chemotaxis protein methyltransferase CheR